jgi:hypothetical protein
MSAAALEQFVTTCPGCAGVAAAHVDTAAQPPVVVRIVCHEGCAVEPLAVLAQLGLLTAATPATAAA